MRKVPIDGGPVTTLATNQPEPADVAVDATSVYWVSLMGSNVMKVAK